MKVSKKLVQIDALGRIRLAKKIQLQFKITNRQLLIEFFVHDGCIELRKWKDKCCFCYCSKNLKEFKKIQICKKCFSELLTLHSNN